MSVVLSDNVFRSADRRASVPGRLDWAAAAAKLDFAFQPIVNIHNGGCIGVEALLRRHDEAGFSSIAEVFDRAFDDGKLFALDLALRDKALGKFRRIHNSDRIRLFYNIDNRVIGARAYDPDLTVRILSKHGLGSQSFCLELSERHKIADEDTLARVVAEYRRQGIAIAIDDFGVGHSGLRFLHRAQPTLVKVDRFFVSDIDRDARKRSIARHVVSVAHSLGIMVVAEGIETEAEFSACRDIAFDYAQGYLIARPELDPEKIQGRYVAIEDAAVDYVFAYVDFDAFKPFNDLYGFRQGDRIIVMFAEMAGKLALKGDRFVGHVGGDDFFVGFRDCDPADAEAEIRALLAEFATCAESFYDAPTRMRGHIVAKDRHGEPRVYQLLTASAVMIRLAPGRLVTTLDDVAQAIAEAKPASKTDPTHLAWARLPEAV